MVTITGVGHQPCELSGKEAEGVFCTFTDGADFSGFLSWASLKQLVIMHAKQKQNGDAEDGLSIHVIEDVK